MVKRLTLRQNFSWTLLGQIVHTGGQWSIVAVLARQGSASMVGEFALAMAIAAPIITFSNLRLRSIQASDSFADYSFSHYLALRLLATLGSLGAIVTFAVLFSDNLSSRMTICFIGFAKSIEAISDIFYGLQQQHDRMDRIARSNLAKGLGSPLAFIIGFYISGQVYGGAIALSACWLGLLVLVDIPSATVTLTEAQIVDSKWWFTAGTVLLIPGSWNWDRLKSLALIAWPLGATSAIAALSTSIPRYAIEFFQGTSDLGIFAAMVYPIAAGSLVVNALAQSALPRLSRSFRSGNIKSFAALLRKLMLVGIFVGGAGILAAIVLGGHVLQLLYGSEYAQYGGLLIWASINAAIRFSYLFLGTALNAMRKFGVQLPIHIFSMGILVVLSITMIDRWGLPGAMAALTAVAIIEAGLYAAVVWKAVNEPNLEPFEVTAAADKGIHAR